MKNEKYQEYFKIELEHFQKAYEIQFNHFMGVFYFWIGVVTIPATAGLLTTDKVISKTNLAYLSLLIAVLAHFISVKMFDIRCSQLRYISNINEARYYLHEIAKKNLPINYQPPFSLSTNLRTTAFKDFGIIMAVVMSALNSLFFGIGISLYQGIEGINWCAFGIWIIIGLGAYTVLVFRRVPKPKSA